MRRFSLQSRLLISATVILAVFLGLTGLVLDGAFRSSSEDAQQGRMQGQLYGLLGASELEQGGRLQMSTDLADARFTQPGSGLVGQVVDGSGVLIWQSPSAIALSPPLPRMLEVNTTDFRSTAIAGENWFSYSYGIAWVDEQDREYRYSYSVLESAELYNRQVSGFRRALVVWLAAAALVLLIVQGVVLRWSLRPMRQIESEVRQIEQGQRDELSEDFPRELKGLAASLNLLIGNERRHLQRYRNSLADLAHSMKTPLAVLRGLAELPASKPPAPEVIETEVKRMNDIVEFQLQKAATAGAASLTAGVLVAPVADRLLASLHKVYRDKSIEYKTIIDKDAAFRGEKGDLMELLGNLLDNASKWCRSTVALNIEPASTTRSDGHGIIICIEDDGPGIDQDKVDMVLQRGQRGDTLVPGHGIGLAMVREIVDSYGGEMSITRSESLGGARITVSF